MTEATREVHLPSDLCDTAERKFGPRLGSLEQILTFVLQQLVREDAVQMDQAEQRIIEQRLKDLGYL